MVERFVPNSLEVMQKSFPAFVDFIKGVRLTYCEHRSTGAVELSKRLTCMLHTTSENTDHNRKKTARRRPLKTYIR